MTHDELVERAAVWLRRKHAVVITEMVAGRETADANGWLMGFSTLVECKASRADFLRDGKKFFRQYPDFGMGTHRYYMAPSGLIQPSELPEAWGLLEVRGSRIRHLVEAQYQDVDQRAEIQLLLSCLRRIGQNPPPGMSLKAYTFQTACTATLGVLEDE